MPKKSDIRVNFAEAARVAQSVQILTVAQPRGSFDITAPNSKRRTGGIGDLRRVHVERDEETFLVQLELSREAVLQEGEEPDARRFDFAATFVLIYQVADAVSFEDDELRSFGAINGLYNVWPYWREFIQSASTRMGLPALTIEVLKIGGGGGGAKKPVLPKKKTRSRKKSGEGAKKANEE